MKPGLRAPAVLDLVWFLSIAVASSLWCVTAANELSATFDEPGYIARGLDGWRTGSHAGLIKIGTMPLAIDLQTLPLFVWEQWRGARFDPTTDLELILPWARAGTLLFWWLLLLYGWLSARALAGPWAGRLAVVLLGSEPVLLGHASLATTDIAVTACLLALLYHFRTQRRAPWSRRVALPMVWFAAAVLAKASGLVLGTLCLLAIEIHRVLREEPVPVFSQWREVGARLRSVWRDVGQIVIGGLVLVFLYCGTDWRPEPSFVAWAHGLPDGAGQHATVWTAEHLRIFSNAGEALVRQIRHNIRGHGSGAYLLGDVQRSFWCYFPLALAIKLSLPLLLGLATLIAWRARALWNWAVVAAAAMLLVSLTAHVQIGVRFFLPLVALLIVGLAAAVIDSGRRTAPGWRRTVLAIGVGAGCAWTATAAAGVWPHGLSYTNELWGGTARGYLLLSDSNYDWGQGLKELLRWQRAHGRAPLDVWYFGTDPAVNTPPLRPLPLHAMAVQSDDDLLAQLRGRTVAASTTLLYGTRMNDAHRRAAALLAAREPAARTTTFLIYDFTTEDTKSTKQESTPCPSCPS